MLELKPLELLDLRIEEIEASIADPAYKKVFRTAADRIDAGDYALAQSKWRDRLVDYDPKFIYKYFDVCFWMKDKLERAKRLNLFDRPPLRILDLGTGAGHFPAVCAALGHEVIGLDVEVPLYTELARLSGSNEIAGFVLLILAFLIAYLLVAPDLHDEFESMTATGGSRPLTFAVGRVLVGVAGLLAAAVVPLSTAYSVAETFGQRADLNDGFRQAPLFYGAYGVSIVVAVLFVLIPGAPLISILFLSQALNAVLLLAILPFLRALARDRELMGAHRLGRAGELTTALVIALVATSVVALLVLSIF